MFCAIIVVLVRPPGVASAPAQSHLLAVEVYGLQHHNGGYETRNRQVSEPDYLPLRHYHDTGEKGTHEYDRAKTL